VRVRGEVSQPYKTGKKITFLDTIMEDKRF
jgi:hypothetical protein